MKSILLEQEFHQWFEHIMFAIYSTKRNGEGKFEIFGDVFKEVYKQG